ncbi:MAG: hypothetical protein ACR2QA_16405 [Solirubrobacteraceae bacterium]
MGPIVSDVVRLQPGQPLHDALAAWRRPSCRAFSAVAVLAVGLGLSACGAANPRQDASEPSGNFTVRVTRVSFPATQRLSQHVHLVITVRNTGARTIPDLAVTITDPSLRDPTSVQAFSDYLGGRTLAGHSRSVWIVDRAPGRCGYSCRSGGAGGAVTAYANTWALGTLPPGTSATFDWSLTAVAPGRHRLRYRLAVGLNGKARAQLRSGGIPAGTFTVMIRNAPRRSYVDNQGRIVTRPDPSTSTPRRR